jgi:hypothetical protein
MTGNLKNALIATISGAAAITSLWSAPANANLILGGVTLPSGAIISNQLVDETLVTGANQTLTGIGVVTAIDSSGLVQTYGYGQGGVFLTFAFTGTSSYVLAPTANAGYVEFSTLTASIYSHPSAPNLATGDIPTDYINATTGDSGTLWLALTAQLLNTNPAVTGAGGPSTTVLEATIPSNATLQSFLNATGAAFFDVTGGAAGFSVLQTCTFADAAALSDGVCPAGFTDISFSETFSAVASGDFPVSGTSVVKAFSVAVPEPFSISLLGMGLIGLAGMSRYLRPKKPA